MRVHKRTLFSNAVRVRWSCHYKDDVEKGDDDSGVNEMTMMIISMSMTCYYDDNDVYEGEEKDDNVDVYETAFNDGQKSDEDC